MTTDATEKLAADMRAALANEGFFAMLDVIADHVDTMMMVHEEYDPEVLAQRGDATGDRPVNAEQLRALNTFEQGLFAKLAPGGLTVEGPITADRGIVTTDLTLSGTFADGSPLNLHSVSDWVVGNGRVVACIARSAPPGEGPDGRAAIMKAIQDLGIEPPAALQDA